MRWVFLSFGFPVVKLDADNGIRADRGGSLPKRRECNFLLAARLVRVDDPHDLRWPAEVLRGRDEDVGSRGARLRLGGGNLAWRHKRGRGRGLHHDAGLGTHLDPSATAAMTYSYRLRCKKGATYSPYSNEVSGSPK